MYLTASVFQLLINHIHSMEVEAKLLITREIMRDVIELCNIPQELL